jgi:N-succinyldiaminopimelate aminotransferase
MPRPPDLTPTAKNLSNRIFSELAQKASRMSRRIYPLHVGDTWRDPIPEALAEAQRIAEYPHMHRYGPIPGEPPLLEAIQSRLHQLHEIHVPIDSLQVTAGATSGLSILAQTLLSPDDEVLVLAPFWPLIRGTIRARGARVIEVPCFDRLDDPDFDLETRIRQAITSKTVAVYVNSPNNPTGRILPHGSEEVLRRIAEEHNLWLAFDEAYEDLYLDGHSHTPLWKCPGVFERAIVSHSFSKTYGLAGARVGYTHGPQNVMEAFRDVQTFQTYSAPRPMQYCALAALRHGESWLEETRRHYREAAEQAAEVLGIPVPVAGTFVFFDASPYLPEAASDVTPFLHRCLDEAGILMTPGAASGEAYHRWARLCFTAVSLPELSEALRALAQLLRR